jgi:hypothetical protein
MLMLVMLRLLRLRCGDGGGGGGGGGDCYLRRGHDVWRLAAALSLEVGSPQVGDVVLGS